MMLPDPATSLNGLKTNPLNKFRLTEPLDKKVKPSPAIQALGKSYARGEEAWKSLEG